MVFRDNATAKCSFYYARDENSAVWTTLLVCESKPHVIVVDIAAHMAKNWVSISLLLCTYGFFREFRPSEPFLTDFLSGEWRNITAEQVTKDVYPWATYSYLAQLVIAFLITDMLRYKPLIVVSASMGCIIWAMMLWTTTLGALQTIEIFYGTYMATEVAYYTYIYAKVDREHFQVVTGFTKSAILAGRFLAATVAQLLVSFQLMNLRELNYLTFGSQIISLFWAIALPAVGTSLYFHGNVETSHSNEFDDCAKTQPCISHTATGTKLTEQPSNAGRMSKRMQGRRAVRLLWTHFTESYSDPVVVQWSLWWALAMCGFTQVQMYIQFLWQTINPDHANVYNGAVEATLTLLGVGGAFAAGYINSKRFEALNLWVLTVCSAGMGGVLLWASLTENVYISYVAYVIFGLMTHFLVTLASVNVAMRLNDDSFGLVFGINTLLALIFQSILTLLVISESGFALGARDQFMVYSGYFVVLAIVYGVTGVVKSIMQCTTNSTAPQNHSIS